MKNKSYVDSFLNLKCSPDVIAATYPINRFDKEISEAMAIINIIKSDILKHKGNVVVLDVCAGNALTSAIIAHLFKPKFTFAFDINPPDRRFDRINNFEYVKYDIYNDNIGFINYAIERFPDAYFVVIGVHPCKSLAEEIIKQYNDIRNDISLAIMPCCSKGNFEIPNFLKYKLNKYDAWVYYLASHIEPNIFGNTNYIIKTDNKCLSPKNSIIYSKKGND